MIRRPGPALLAMEPADGTWQREENRCDTRGARVEEQEATAQQEALAGDAAALRESTQQPARQEGQEQQNEM